MTRGSEPGEPSTVEALYDAFAPSLYRYAWSLLGEEDTGQAAEAVHDGLVAGVVLDSRRADPADLGSWLYALVRSACQRRGLAHVSPYTRLATVPAEEPVARMFARLPASHRELVELNLRHALPTSAVARVLGLDPQICGELTRSAIRRAAENLDGRDGDHRVPDPRTPRGAGAPDGDGPDDRRTARRRWPMAAVSGLATVVLAVALWGWASAVGGPSTMIGAGPDEAERGPLVPQVETDATSADTKPEAGPTAEPPTAPTGPAEPGAETEPRQEDGDGSGHQAPDPAPERTTPAPPPQEASPPSGGQGPDGGPDAPGEEEPGDDDAPGGPPEEGGDDDGGGTGLLDGLLGLLFGGG
ncbi:sigma-70 family RNA polymerase sigma factor [Nocardiopsis dassonvillei]|uniref:RNA polymerase sigma factor n=1 Tax=Nocardiopsis dassonvillei TaxID=2014 RepID=UPI0020107A00|nr:sigma-70 family RNA polymerase sigma factor [Nocardiopsis dassonvillei]MCK9873142.1 sigma-70 family RNA polymerase sigma factor [Nocardiopsis dassonvillei]